MSNLYYMRGPPARLHYVAALLGVALLAGAAWGLGSWARRSGSRGFENAARAGFLGALLLAANAVLDQLPFGLRSALHGNLAAAGVALLALACAGAAAWSLWRRPARLYSDPLLEGSGRLLGRSLLRGRLLRRLLCAPG